MTPPLPVYIDASNLTPILEEGVEGSPHPFPQMLLSVQIERYRVQI